MNERYIWISHELNSNTPVYGGGEGFQASYDKKISLGSSCNSTKLTLPNHLGTHVDVPYHFIDTGKKISDYEIEQWLFFKIQLLEINVNIDEIITLSKLQPDLDTIRDVDFLLIKTGFEQYRTSDIYWRHSPAFSDEIAFYLKETFTSISAIGFDTISLTGFQHRELGRKAHKAFLSQDIRIFEDLHLSELTNQMILKQIIAMPLRFENADGSPCTIICVVKGK